MPRIRVIDFETTGMSPESQVVEHGWCDLVQEEDSGWRIDGHGSELHEVDVVPPDARAIHHISARDTQGFPGWDPDRMWWQAHQDAVDVIAAHNAAFDGHFWGDPKLPVICTFKSARRLWTLEPPSHSNGALRYWLEDRGVITVDPVLAYPPHRAGPDAYVTAHVLMAMLRVVPARQMVAWSRLPTLMPTCPIGKQWRGKPWAEVDAGFLNWVLRQDDMEADIVFNAREELERRQPVI